ncbi:UBP43 hydrolase, partial [Nesospiza acunhae]|nr:UBP43 hydrolase [Nesospiza acunhae]
NIVSKHSSQFRGNAQHDALEFLLWLLDRMHEDLGAASPAQQSRGPAQVSAPPGSGGGVRAGSGARDSGMRGSLAGTGGAVIPHCDWWEGVDPSLGLVGGSGSLAGTGGAVIPHCDWWEVVDPLIGIGGSMGPPCCDWSEAVAPHREWGRQFLLGLVGNGYLWLGLVGPVVLGRTMLINPALMTVPRFPHSSGCPRSLPTSPAVPRPEGPRLLPSAAHSSDCLHRAPGGRILLLLCNTAGTGPQLARFGPPLVLREERGVSWEQLQQNILAQLRGVLRGEVRPQGTGVLFRIRLAGGSAPCTYLSPQDPRPLCHPAIDRALQLCGAGGPPHVRLTVEWDTSTKERLFGSIQEEVVQDAESVRQQQQAHGQQHSCTLDECFQLYTKEEQVWAPWQT